MFESQGGGTSKPTCRRKPLSFLAQLKAASVRDKEFIAAYERERARKLAIQEEAELKNAVEQSVQSFGRGIKVTEIILGH